MYRVQEEDLQQRSQLLRVLRSRHTLALGLLAALASSSYVALDWVVRSHERMGAVINETGRQRMLSQRIALTVSELSRADEGSERERLRVSLRELIRAMRKGHAYLVAGGASVSSRRELSAPIRALYFDGASPLDLRLRAFLDDAEAVAEGSLDKQLTAKVIATSMSEILDDLDRVVETLQAQTEAETTLLRHAHLGFLALTLLLLAALARWVFKPMTRQVLDLVSRCVGLSREKAIQDAQLQAAQSLQARARLSALGELAAGVAHEMNNPLLIVQGTVSQLSRALERCSVDPERFALGLSTIDVTLSRMARIIRGLLLFAREDEQERMSVLSVRDLVEHAAELCRSRLVHHGIALHIAQIDPALVLECQRVHLTEVLVNLLLNAFAAVSAEESSWIAITASAVGEHIEIAVSDSGKGIPPELREKIMRPFFTTKPVGEGVGLGLSIAFGVVETHGGSLSLDETSPNTRFVVRLPRTQPSRRRAASA